MSAVSKRVNLTSWFRFCLVSVFLFCFWPATSREIQTEPNKQRTAVGACGRQIEGKWENAETELRQTLFRLLSYAWHVASRSNCWERWENSRELNWRLHDQANPDQREKPNQTIFHLRSSAVIFRLGSALKTRMWKPRTCESRWCEMVGRYVGSSNELAVSKQVNLMAD